MPIEAVKENMGETFNVGEPMSWRVNREVVILLGWPPAILAQFAHPLVAAGIAEHSSFSGDPSSRIARLWSTLDAMFGLVFGDIEESQRAANRINSIHDRVSGVLPERAGVYSAGTLYTAHDPELLRWVHATLSDALLRTYELFIGPLTVEEKDRYCAEAAETEPALGIPDGYLPRSFDELEEYMRWMLSNGRIVITAAARSLAHDLLDSSPFPVIAWPVYSFMHFVTVGLMRPEIREMFGFGWNVHQEAVIRTSATVLRHTLPMVPALLRQWPAARAAQRRSRQGYPVIQVAEG